MSAPDRIWAKLDRATVYMDGSSPLVASTREFSGSVEYVTVSKLNEAVSNSGGPAGDLLVAALPDEDDIEQVITDSLDIDWTPRDAAKAVMRLLQTGENGEGSEGERLGRCCPFDPNSDPKNENIDASTFNLVLSALTDLERYLRDTPHHNSTQAAAARYAINKAGGMNNV